MKPGDVVMWGTYRRGTFGLGGQTHVYLERATKESDLAFEPNGAIIQASQLDKFLVVEAVRIDRGGTPELIVRVLTSNCSMFWLWDDDFEKAMTPGTVVRPIAGRGGTVFRVCMAKTIRGDADLSEFVDADILLLSGSERFVMVDAINNARQSLIRLLGADGSMFWTEARSFEEVLEP